MIFPTPDQLALFKKTPGAFSVHEMVAAINVAAKAPYGTCLELGAHRGKSGIANAIGLSQGPNRVLHLCDPLYDMNNLEAWSHSCQGHPDNAWQGAKEPGFNGSVVNTIHIASGGTVSAELHGDFSEHCIPHIHGQHGDYAYVFLDSDQHTYEMLKKETDLLRDNVKVGGILSFHDLFSQFLGVEQVYRELLQGGVWHEISIDWDSIKEWVAANGGESGSDSWHHNTNPQPMFFGALVKVK